MRSRIDRMRKKAQEKALKSDDNKEDKVICSCLIYFTIESALWLKIIEIESNSVKALVVRVTVSEGVRRKRSALNEETIRDWWSETQGLVELNDTISFELVWQYFRWRG